MQIEVKFFGSIRFDIGVDRRKFIVKKESTIDDVLNLILSDYGEKARRAFYTKDGKSNKFIVFINNRKIPIAVIGPTTALAARELNLKPTIQPPQSDEQSFVEEIKRYFGVME